MEISSSEAVATISRKKKFNFGSLTIIFNYGYFVYVSNAYQRNLFYIQKYLRHFIWCLIPIYRRDWFYLFDDHR